jgi:hypothetical protein
MEPRLGGAVHSQKPNADERPLNHRKHPSYKSNLSRLSFAMLSGTSLCNCRSFDSINADLGDRPGLALIYVPKVPVGWPPHIANCLKYDPAYCNGIADALGIRLGDAEKDVA